MKKTENRMESVEYYQMTDWWLNLPFLTDWLTDGNCPPDGREHHVHTASGKREFVPRDQVFSFLVIYCSLFLHLS